MKTKTVARVSCLTCEQTLQIEENGTKQISNLFPLTTEGRTKVRLYGSKEETSEENYSVVGITKLPDVLSEQCTVNTQLSYEMRARKAIICKCLKGEIATVIA